MEFPAADRRRDRYYNMVDNEGHQHIDISSNKSPNSLQPSSSSSVAAANAATDTEEREYMFEKVVTPSDVGKLNRLVIPKQHAERYFPLDPASNDKGGLLLSFEEDRTGRPWRFRYSYWNSSQSYVMTKGWSRFVKDKRLDAGDTVAFSRTAATGRLFIDWRRRPDPPLLLRSTVVPTWGWGGLFSPHPPPLLHQTSSSTTITSTNNNSDAAAAAAAAMYFRSMGPTLPPPQLRMDGILDSVPMPVSCSAEPKRVRLFGVNLDCTEHDRADQYLQPPSPLQWRLSPVPSPVRSELPQLPSPSSQMDQDGARGQKEGSF